MHPVKAILFDLDGTLLDSAPDLVAALNWLRATEGLSALDTRSMSRHVSHGALGILTAGMPATTQSQFDEWKAMFLARYASVGYCDSRLYDGVPELLASLRRQGITWGIVTNKIESLTTPILKASGLAEQSACVVCGDTLSLSKPDPAPVLFACGQLNVDPADTVFAGDDIRDLQAGRSAGTKVVAVMYGYGSHEFDAGQLTDCVAINSPLGILDLLN